MRSWYCSRSQNRRAPSPHCRDARVFGHTTTTMHEIEYTPPPPPYVPLRTKRFVCARVSYGGCLFLPSPITITSTIVAVFAFCVSSIKLDRTFGGIPSFWQNLCTVAGAMERGSARGAGCRVVRAGTVAGTAALSRLVNPKSRCGFCLLDAMRPVKALPVAVYCCRVVASLFFTNTIPRLRDRFYLSEFIFASCV